MRFKMSQVYGAFCRVEIGSLLYYNAQVAYTEGNFVTSDTLLSVDVSRRQAPRNDS